MQPFKSILCSHIMKVIVFTDHIRGPNLTNEQYITQICAMIWIDAWSLNNTKLQTPKEQDVMYNAECSYWNQASINNRKHKLSLSKSSHLATHETSNQPGANGHFNLPKWLCGHVWVYLLA